MRPTTPDLQSFFTDQHGIGFLQRLWIRVRREANHEAIFVLVKRNYNMYANIGVTTRSTNRFVAILDTGAGFSFIRHSEIPHAMQKPIHKSKDQLDVRHASGKVVPI